MTHTRLLLFFFLLTACSRIKEETNALKINYNHGLIDTGKRLVIPIDEETLNQTNCLSLTQRNASILAYLNSKKNTIQFYNLETKTLEGKIKLAIEGPNGIGNIQGFNAISLDSVFVISTQYSKIFLLNKEGEVQQTINYLTSISGNDIMPAKIQSEPLQRIEFTNNKIYLTDLASGNWQTMSQKELLKTSLCVEIDSLNKTVTQLPFSYPADYWADGNKEPIFSRIYENETFIYSFSGDNNIYVTQDHATSKKYFAGSKYIKTVNPYPKNMDMDDLLRYYCETSTYSTIVFDPFRNVYYRFAFLGKKPEKGENLMKKVMNPSSPTIVILDETFNIIGETKLDENKYIVKNMFINEKGLYLSLNHIANPSMKDDELSFALLELKKL